MYKKKWKHSLTWEVSSGKKLHSNKNRKSNNQEMNHASSILTHAYETSWDKHHKKQRALGNYTTRTNQIKHRKLVWIGHTLRKTPNMTKQGMEAKGNKKTRKTQEQLEKVCGSRSKRSWNIPERSGENMHKPEPDAGKLWMTHAPQRAKGLK